MRRSAFPYCFAAVLATGLHPGEAHGEDDRGTWSFNWENDIYGGTDRNYSNGVRLSYVSPAVTEEGFHRWLADTIVGLKEGDSVRYGFAVGHSIFTPEDTETAAPLPDQHPYAGYLYGEYAGYIQDIDTLSMLALQVGVVGPAALGEEVQNNFHEVINSYEVLGWDNQLDNEVVFALMYERKERAWVRTSIEGLDFDVTPHWGVSLGTLHTQGKAGATFRLGGNLRNDFGPPRVRPALGGGGFFESAPGFNWYVFAGVEGRAVARNIFLDGNTFKDNSPSVDKEHFVIDGQAGVVLQYGPAQLSWTFVTRTREFKTQSERQQFGAVSVSVKF